MRDINRGCVWQYFAEGRKINYLALTPKHAMIRSKALAQASPLQTGKYATYGADVLIKPTIRALPS